MSWVIARLPPPNGGDEDEYVHAFDLLGKTPSNVKWTRIQTLAHRFTDRNEAARLCIWVDASARPRRIVPAISGEERVAGHEASATAAWAEVRRVKGILRVICSHKEMLSGVDGRRICSTCDFVEPGLQIGGVRA